MWKKVKVASSKKSKTGKSALKASGDVLLTVGEMYCGPGGLGLASSLARHQSKGTKYRFKHSWATDHHPDSCATYRRNIIAKEPGADVFCEDIRKLDIKKLPAVDGFMYGFPCNDFSNVGESKGLDGKFGPLYKYGIKYLNAHNPLFFLAENVSGLSNANEGNAFSTIQNELSKAGKHGYRLTTHLYKFEQYGVPQARHRIIIVGIRKDLDIRFEVPKPSNEVRSCSDAILNPPIPNDAPNNELTKQSAQVAERLSYIKPGENVWTAKLPKRLELNVKGARLSQIYRRLDPKKPSYTVTGSGGGGTHVYHWSENRALTNRERARLQTFPDSFVFEGSKESVRRQIGMAVPVQGARVILEAVLKTLAGTSYNSIKPSVGYVE